MKTAKTLFTAAGTGLAAFLLLAPWAHSQPPGGAAAASGRGPGGRVLAPDFNYNDNAGYQSLFDGKTLKGWEGAPGMWDVRDGAIHIDTACEHPTGTTYLYWTGGEPGDFILKYDMKGTVRVNGGMQIRSFLTSDPNAPKYPARAGAGGPARGNSGGAAAAGRGATAGRGASGRGAGGGAQQASTCPTPPPPAPSRESLAKWNMNGYQVDFDANNQWPGNIYEQGGRGVMTTPGHSIIAEPGQPVRADATIADKATLDSWFKKDDYNQMMVIAVGHTLETFMNGHLVFVMIDNDPTYFRAKGKIALEVENTGGYWTKNIYLKILN